MRTVVPGSNTTSWTWPRGVPSCRTTIVCQTRPTRSRRPQRWHREMEDDEIDRDVDFNELASAVALLRKLVGKRDGWERDARYETDMWLEKDWVFTPSFNGVFIGDRLYPRTTDVGLEPLQVQLVGATRIHLHSCGVRDGCEPHRRQTKTFPLSELDGEAFQGRLSAYEVCATSIPLRDMSWCIFTGNCSRLPIIDIDNHP